MRKMHPGRMNLLLVGVLLLLLALYMLNASRAGSEVVGCPRDCATASERSPGPLRVISLNMLHGFPSFTDLALRVNLIAAELKRHPSQDQRHQQQEKR